MKYNIIIAISFCLAVLHGLVSAIERKESQNVLEPSKTSDTEQREAVVAVIEAKKAEAKSALSDLKSELKKVNENEAESTLTVEDLPPDEANEVKNIVQGKQLESEAAIEESMDTQAASKVAIADKTSKVGHMLNDSQEKHSELVEAIVDGAAAKTLSKDSLKVNGVIKEQTRNMKRVNSADKSMSTSTTTSNSLIKSGTICVPSEANFSSTVGPGLFVLWSIAKGDTWSDALYCIKNLLNVRIFSDENKIPWKKSVMDCNYEILIQSQFTSYATIKRNNPNFNQGNFDPGQVILAMKYEEAYNFYGHILLEINKCYNYERIKTGMFGYYSDIHLNLDGPVTFIIDSAKNKIKDN